MCFALIVFSVSRGFDPRFSFSCSLQVCVKLFHVFLALASPIFLFLERFLDFLDFCRLLFRRFFCSKCSLGLQVYSTFFLLDFRIVRDGFIREAGVKRIRLGRSIR